MTRVPDTDSTTTDAYVSGISGDTIVAGAAFQEEWASHRIQIRGSNLRWTINELVLVDDTITEPLDFAYTSTSLNDVYALSFDHALELIEASGGHVEDDTVRIPIQQAQRVLLEVSFEGVFTLRRRAALRLSEQ